MSDTNRKTTEGADVILVDDGDAIRHWFIRTIFADERIVDQAPVVPSIIREHWPEEDLLPCPKCNRSNVNTPCAYPDFNYRDCPLKGGSNESQTGS
jgi:hypothetical protein